MEQKENFFFPFFFFLSRPSLFFSFLKLRQKNKTNKYFDGRIGGRPRIVQYLVKGLEEGGLKEHGRHFAVPGDAVEHFRQAVVGQRRIGPVGAQQRAVGLDDLAVREPVTRWCVSLSFRPKKKQTK